MFRCEFSETQFMLGYTKELWNTIPGKFFMYAPSTKEEKKTASDLVLRVLGKKRKFRYSEFYQFKRSKYYKYEIFTDLRGGVTIDTSVQPMFGFNIYNSKNTRQFNVLQKLARQPRNRVYYCAPLFNLITQFNIYFQSNNIQNHSKVFDISQPQMQKIKIPLNSNHKIIFDKTQQYICSDPIEIEGHIASQRNQFKRINDNVGEQSLTQELNYINQIIQEELLTAEINLDIPTREVNFFSVRELLISWFNIYWFPIF